MIDGSLAVFLAIIAATLVHSDQTEIISGNNKFGIELTYEIISDGAKKSLNSSNVFISPLSISSCMSLVFPGAGGATKSQIANVFHYPSGRNNITEEYLYYSRYLSARYNTDPFVMVGNRIWIEDDFRSRVNQTYIRTIGNDYFSFLDINGNLTDSLKKINEWIANQTEGLIDDMFSTLPNDTALIATNTLYLNASWYSSFDSSLTSTSPFYSNYKRETVAQASSQLMHKIDYFDYYSDKSFQLVRLWLKSRNIYVLIALPLDATSDLHASEIFDKVNKLNSTYLALAVPKFVTHHEYLLKSYLRDLGLRNPFTDSASFPYLFNNISNLYISDILHNTYLNFNENGVTAAAATGVIIGITSVMTHPTPILMKVDHPFYIGIVDNTTNMILFMGHVKNPIAPLNSNGTYNESSNSIWTTSSNRHDSNKKNIWQKITGPFKSAYKSIVNFFK